MTRPYCVLLSATIIALFGQTQAQDNWGPAEFVCGIAGCTWSISNPCVDQLGRPCFEFGSNAGTGIDKLYYFSDSLHLLPGDSLNLDEFDNHSPFITYDGQYLYFSSNRPGGYGGYDIWVSPRQGDSWGPPRNLGPPVNSETNEFGASLPVSGTEIYFCRTSSNEPWSSGSAIYCSEKIGGQWSAPVRLPEPINSNAGDFEPAISSDGNTLYFASFRDNGQQAVFAYVSYSQQDIWSTPLPLNSNINHFSYCDFDSLMHCLVYSVSLDSSGLAMYFTYYYVCAFISGIIELSHQTIGIDQPQQLPELYSIGVYPNPFNSRTTIWFDLPIAGKAKLAIYDLTGRLVSVLADENLIAGRHSYVWQPFHLPSGVYFAHLRFGNAVSTQKLLLLK
jgi:hypothetical protein